MIRFRNAILFRFIYKAFRLESWNIWLEIEVIMITIEGRLFKSDRNVEAIHEYLENVVEWLIGNDYSDLFLGNVTRALLSEDTRVDKTK